MYLENKINELHRLVPSLPRRLCQADRPSRCDHLIHCDVQRPIKRPISDLVKVSTLMTGTEIWIWLRVAFYPDCGDQTNICRASQTLADHIDTVVCFANRSTVKRVLNLRTCLCDFEASDPRKHVPSRNVLCRSPCVPNSGTTFSVSQ